MAKTVNLDNEYADILLDMRGNLSIAEGSREVLLTVLQLLRTTQGEWNQDTTLGLPFETELRAGIIDANIAPGIIETEILSVDGVQSANVRNIETERRVMTMDIEIDILGAGVVVIERFTLHPSDSGAVPPVPENILGWLGNELNWTGNYISWDRK